MGQRPLADEEVFAFGDDIGRSAERHLELDAQRLVESRPLIRRGLEEIQDRLLREVQGIIVVHFRNLAPRPATAVLPGAEG